MRINDISSNITVDSLLENFPTSSRFLTHEGVVCFVCGEPTWGTLGEIIDKKGLDIEDIIAGLKKFLEAGQ